MQPIDARLKAEKEILVVSDPNDIVLCLARNDCARPSNGCRQERQSSSSHPESFHTRPNFEGLPIFNIGQVNAENQARHREEIRSDRYIILKFIVQRRFILFSGCIRKRNG
jgi:hypothetical protein